MSESSPATSVASVATRRAPSTRMLADVRSGLLAARRELPPTYFYDAEGSRLFDEITRLPEYYLTRAERAVLEAEAGTIVREVQPRALAELGAGTATKSRVLLRAMLANGAVQYLPMDVDGATLRATAAALRAELPELEVTPIVADMRDDVRAAGARHPLLYAFLGSTIGNFTPEGAQQLLARIRATLQPADRLLLGIDLVKDAGTLEAAYNDSRGVTAAFNRNVLRVLNRELGADFDPDAFVHRAPYNRDLHRVEMHLVARRPQRVHVPGIGTLSFDTGDSIRTEISCKYDEPAARALLRAAGFSLARWMTDPAGRFALVLADPLS